MFVFLVRLRILHNYPQNRKIIINIYYLSLLSRYILHNFNYLILII